MHVATALVGTSKYLVYAEGGSFNVYQEEGPEGCEYLVFITRCSSRREVSEFFQMLKAESYESTL